MDDSVPFWPKSSALVAWWQKKVPQFKGLSGAHPLKLPVGYILPRQYLGPLAFVTLQGQAEGHHQARRRRHIALRGEASCGCRAQQRPFLLFIREPDPQANIAGLRRNLRWRLELADPGT